MNSTRLFGTLLAIGAVLALVLWVMGTACSSGGGGGGGGGDGGGGNDNTARADTEWGDIQGPEPIALQLEEGTRASGTISAASGGTLTATGWATMSLEIPAGALPADTEVTITLASDPSERFAVLAVLEPDGLVLNTPATLVITLSEALPPGMKLTIAEANANDLSDFADTGILAEVSDDGTTVRVRVEHFSGAGAYVNCHGHSLRRIIQSLTAPTDQGGQGMTKQQVLDEIRATVGDKWVERKPGMDDTDYQLAAFDAWDRLDQKFDLLANNDTRVTADAGELMAFLNTFYAPADVSFDPLLENGQVQTDAAGNAVVSSTKEACIQKLGALAGRKHHLPPIFNLGQSLPSQSDENVTILSGVSHSFPVMMRDDAPVIEQGLNIEANQSDRLQAARETFQRDHPEEWAARGMTMPPRGVAVMPLTSFDRFRSQPSGAAVNDEYGYWGGEGDLMAQSTTKFPWVAARVWVPRGEYVNLCTDCTSSENCDDGEFCNGAETCVNELCEPGTDPCQGDPCDEATGECQGDNANDNTTIDPNQVVTFADPCLADQVRILLNKPSGDLTAGELATLTYLERTGSSISSLSGLEYCVNLTYVSLVSNEIIDLTPLSGLTQLTSLTLSDNNISDLSPLAQMTWLEVLHLSDNQIGDVSPLAGLSSLVVLDLSRQAGGLPDISPLGNLTALTELSLSSNNISDISALSSLTELWKLILYWNDVTDVSPLQGLPKLNALWLDSNPIDDFGPLAANSAIGEDDYIVLTCCPGLLDCDTADADSTQCGYKDQMEARGADVVYGGRETCGTPAPVLGLNPGPCVLYGTE